MQQKSIEHLTLIQMAQSGDEAAFSKLIEHFYDQMYRFALKYSGSVTDAEDITQQACLKLARSLHQFRFESAFTTWLYRLVINCAKDWYRGRPDTTSTENLTFEVSDTRAESMILLQQTLDTIDGMGEGFRESVTLVLGEGHSHRQAAELLGVKESTISWRIHEARKRLAAGEAYS
jgi:RNA polymerase sigma-70 factor (ECF subfamily)